MNASEQRYELADFHPETGHRHHCEDPTGCDCAAWLYGLAVQAHNPVPTGWWVTRIEPVKPIDFVKHFLRWASGGWVCDDDAKDFRAALWTLEHVEPSDLTCCPLCQEVVCDDDCPLYPVRDEAGIWVGSKGATRE